MTAIRNLVLTGVVLLGCPAEQATAVGPIGLFDLELHNYVEITFQFAPVSAGPPYRLNLGLGGSLVPPSSGYSGGVLQLYDEGGLISDSSILSILGPQGNWASYDNTGDSLNIDSFVDLSGIAAGEVGRIVLRPTFIGPVGIASFSTPSLGFTGAGPATILSQRVVAIPEPVAGTMLAVGLASLMALRVGR